MVKTVRSESESAPFGARFAVWQHLTPGDIFSESELPEARTTDAPLPMENPGAITVGGNTAARPFQTEDDIKRWWEEEVFPKPQERSSARLVPPPDVVEVYKQIAEAQGVNIAEDHNWSYESVRQPSIQDHLDVVCGGKNGFGEPPALTRKGFWPCCGPVRYRGEYTGKVPRQQFRDFYPEKEIGKIPLRPDFDKRMVVIGQGEGVQLSGYFPLPKCALGGDWDGNKLFPLADMRRKIEGRRLPTALHAFALAVYEAMDALNLLYPSLPARSFASRMTSGATSAILLVPWSNTALDWECHPDSGTRACGRTKFTGACDPFGNNWPTMRIS
jgi:hypothetical protein